MKHISLLCYLTSSYAPHTHTIFNDSITTWKYFPSKSLSLIVMFWSRKAIFTLHFATLLNATVSLPLPLPLLCTNKFPFLSYCWGYQRHDQATAKKTRKHAKKVMMKNSLDDGNLQRLHKHVKSVNRKKAKEEFHSNFSHLLNNFNNRDIFLHFHLLHILCTSQMNE